MRIPLLIATAILIAATPVMAKEKKKTQDNSPVFGKTYCRPTFRCANLNNPEEMSRIESKALSLANRCVKKRYFRSTKMTKFFKSSYGLDSRLCFKPVKMTKSKSGLALTPKCCIQPKHGKKGQCQVVCTIYGRR